MKPTTQIQSYIGQSVYAGIDVHKRTYAVVTRVNQLEEKRWTTVADPEKLGQQLCKRVGWAPPTNTFASIQTAQQSVVLAFRRQ